MNYSKLVLSLSCLVTVTLASPVATAAPRGGGGYGGGHFAGGHGFAGRPGMGAWSGRNWNGRNWSGRNWNGRNWNGRNWNNWNGNWHHHGHNNVIFIGDFGFPGWWGWGWGAGWGWGYPYGYYGYGYPYYGYGYGYGYPGYGYGDYGYGNGYGYGYSSGGQYSSPTRSRVAELQRRLARAGYYHGSIDGVLGPQTRRAIRAYEADHGYADAR
jgi:hypothetical protein